MTMTIKELRKQTGLSQSQFAKKFHLNVRTLQTWEQNTRPTPEYVIFLIKSIINNKEDVAMTGKLSIRSMRCLDENLTYDLFRSEICHMLNYYKDLAFVEIILRHDFIGVFWKKHWYAKAFYTLSILDYLSDQYDMPYFAAYDQIRSQKLSQPQFPQDINILEKLGNNAKKTAIKECQNSPIGKYFYKYNIVEWSIYDVI